MKTLEEIILHFQITIPIVYPVQSLNRSDYCITSVLIHNRVATAVEDKNQPKYVKLVMFSQPFCTIFR